MTAAALKLDEATPGKTVLYLSGHLDAYSVSAVWSDALRILRGAPDTPLVADCAAVTYCDGAGVALLVDLLRQPRQPGAEVRVENLAPDYRTLLDQVDPASYRIAPAQPP